jgi:hypothetical protein
MLVYLTRNDPSLARLNSTYIPGSAAKYISFCIFSFIVLAAVLLLTVPSAFTLLAKRSEPFS